MVKIKQGQSGTRLDVFLLEQLEERGYEVFSRSYLTNNWDDLVKVNEQYPKPSYKLKLGDTVLINIKQVERLKEEMQRSEDIISQEGVLDILLECKDFLILEKPKGVVVHPGIANRQGTLANYVKGYLEAKGIFDLALDRAGVVHRLDKAVSGLMVFAKTLAMQKHLKQQFEKHKVQKVYLADIEFNQLKRGIKSFFPKESLEIEEEITRLENNDFKCDRTWLKADGYIRRSPSNRVEMEFKNYMSRSSKKALSYIKPISQEKALIVIKTGRMHQIRATLEYFGIGIKGDTLYGISKSSTLPEKIALRSILLGFKELEGEDFTIIKY